MSSHPTHTSFKTSSTSKPTSTRSSLHTIISSVTAKATSAVQPTTVPLGPKSKDGFGPTAIIGIVAAMTFLLLCVPVIALLLRRYERKRCHEIPADQRSCKSSVRNESLKRIIVTKELQRESLKLSACPEVHLKGERIRSDAKGAIKR